jgi:hypothetical protein
MLRNVRRVVFLAFFISCCALPAPAPVRAAAPTPAPRESASEMQFVSAASKDLQSRFGTTAQARAGGYFQYTPEDVTGAISWVNTSNWTSDPKHPSQLWYDVKGHLIGADFSVYESASPKRPDLWGVSPSRWQDFSPAHVHFAIKSSSGLNFGYALPSWMKAIGGSLAQPTKADVVKLGTLKQWKSFGFPPAKTTSDVAFVFPFPAVWDLQVWLVPNPLGAFAEHNPNVKPSPNAKYTD